MTETKMKKHNEDESEAQIDMENNENLNLTDPKLPETKGETKQSENALRKNTVRSISFREYHG
jgi:hypothetical protein